jgi:hypothetical protein
MIWKPFISFFILKQDINKNSNQNIQYNNINIPPTIDRWETIRNINKNNTIMSHTRKYTIYDGYDHRPFNDSVDMYNITVNHLKMKLLKRLESKDLSVNDKLESINRNKLLLNDNDKKSSIYVNLLAGDLLDNW